MRTDVRLGLAVGSVLLVGVLVYVMFFTGPSGKQSPSPGGVFPAPGVVAGGGAPRTSGGLGAAPSLGSGSGSPVATTPPGGLASPRTPGDVHVGPTTHPAESIVGTPPLADDSSRDSLLEPAPARIASSGGFSWSDLLTRGREGDSGLATTGAGTRLSPGAASVAAQKYVVKSGDTLWAISEKVYGSGAHVNDIAKANPGIDPQRLRMGMSLNLPDKSVVVTDTVTRTASATTPATLDQTTHYRVTSGDTLSGIAKKLYGSSAMAGKLYDANKDVIANPNALKPDMVLRLPQAPSSSRADVAATVTEVR
jgi:nucleoid-associated protein YgaU